MAPKTQRPTPPLLRLPLELRQLIYAYLLPLENVSHPLPAVGITSVSHRPPSSSMLNIHPLLTSEILDYFYTLATWKLVFSHAFNFFRVDPELRRLESSPNLSSLRKVELVFFCDVLLLQSYPSFGVERFCEEIERRASRACDVLSRAKRLRVVVVSWCDSTATGHWEEKAEILRPLRKLKDKNNNVTFRVGTVNGSEGLTREDFAKAVRDVLGTKERVDTGYDGIEECEKDLRMLAFDVRQDRRQFSTKPGDFPYSTVGRRSGWRGAPPSMEVPLESENEVET